MRRKTTQFHEQRHDKRVQRKAGKRREKARNAAIGRRTVPKAERRANAVTLTRSVGKVFQSERWRERLQTRVVALFSDEVEEGDKAA